MCWALIETLEIFSRDYKRARSKNKKGPSLRILFIIIIVIII